MAELEEKFAHTQLSNLSGAIKALGRKYTRIVDTSP
jgi:hypothetical protein